MFLKKMFIAMVILLGTLSAETITHNGVTYGTVISPNTGKIWLDRNLGATMLCDNVRNGDDGCYGWLYQWGRGNDGHQNPYSNTVRYENKSSNEIRFITHSRDWKKDIDPNGTLREEKWNRTDGTSVCPIGFKVPSLQEIQEERKKGIQFFNNIYDGAFRKDWSGFVESMSAPFYWTSSPDIGTESALYGLTFANPSGSNYNYRSTGLFVRCIKSEIIISNDVMNKVKENSLEVFLASHIYDRTAGDLYKTYRINYLGNTSTVMLSEYEDNPESGFTAGLYEVVDGYKKGDIIIAFGGTSAADRQNASNAVMPDVLTDLNLLNFSKEDKQIEETREFMNSMVNRYGLQNSNVKKSITGHSLGGGLAQYASMYTDIRAVTINTAPIPISEESQSYVTYTAGDIAKADYTTYLRYKDQISNFMAPLDPLTSMLYFVEEYETNRQNDTKRIDNVINALNDYTWFKVIKATDQYLSMTELAPVYAYIKNVFIQDLAYLFGSYTNDKLDDSKSLDSIYFYKAIIDLKYNNIQGFINNIKLAYGIPSIVKLQNLIMGERFILPMSTPLASAHLMQPFLDSSSNYFGSSPAIATEVRVDTNGNGLSDTAEKKLHLIQDSTNTVDVVATESKVNLKYGETDDMFDSDIYIVKVKKTGMYTFSTKGSMDTIGDLYDANFKLVLTNDDISYSNYNFKFSKQLYAGETYYLKVSGWLDGGSYVLVTQLKEDKTLWAPIMMGDIITFVPAKR